MKYTIATSTRLNDKVADGRYHHKFPPLFDLRASRYTSMEELVLQRTIVLQLAPSDGTRGAFVHGKTRFFVDVDSSTNGGKEPAEQNRYAYI